MRQYEIAKKHRIGAPLLSRVLTGKVQTVNADTALKLAKVFDLPVERVIRIIKSGKTQILKKRFIDLYESEAK